MCGVKFSKFSGEWSIGMICAKTENIVRSGSVTAPSMNGVAGLIAFSATRKTRTILTMNETGKIDARTVTVQCAYWNCPTSSLLRGRPVGRVTRLAHPSVTHGLLNRKQENVEIKFSIEFPRARVSGVPNFTWKGQRSRSPDVKNHRKLGSVLLTGGGSGADGLGANCELGLTIVRPNLLYAPNVRRSATGRTAAYHVSTRRRHAFLF